MMKHSQSVHSAIKCCRYNDKLLLSPKVGVAELVVDESQTELSINYGLYYISLLLIMYIFTN